MKARSVTGEFKSTKPSALPDISFHQKMIFPETRAEFKFLTRIRKRAQAAAESMRGRHGYVSLRIERGRFKGLYAAPLELRGDEAGCLVVTMQFLLLISGNCSERESIHFRPVYRSPKMSGTGFLCFDRRDDQESAMVLFSKDTQRAITVVCEDPAVICKLISLVAGDTEFDEREEASQEGAPSNETKREWTRLENQAERLCVKVKTFEEAQNALRRFAGYLMPIQFEGKLKDHKCLILGNCDRKDRK